MEYLGVRGTRHQQQTGAGHYDEEEDGEDGEDGEGEEDEEDEDLEEESVQVELTQSPFPNAQLRAVFEGALQETVNDNFIAQGYGVLPQEWEDGEYPSTEVLQVGRKRSGQMVIHLPVDVWLPRAELWANALSLTAHVLLNQ